MVMATIAQQQRLITALSYDRVIPVRLNGALIDDYWQPHFSDDNGGQAVKAEIELMIENAIEQQIEPYGLTIRDLPDWQQHIICDKVPEVTIGSRILIQLRYVRTK